MRNKAKEKLRKLRVMRTDEVSSLLQISDKMVLKLVSNGEFPKPIRIGKELRWLESMVNRHLLREQRKANEPEANAEDEAGRESANTSFPSTLPRLE